MPQAPFTLSVGDVIEFPEHEQNKSILTGRYSVLQTHGLAGRFRVIEIMESGIRLEKLENATSTPYPFLG